MAPGLGGFNIEPPATPESIPPLNDVREPRGLKPDIIRPPSGTERYRLCAIEQNSARARDGRLLLAPKVIVAVIGIIGIALLAFPDPMRKLVDSFGRIKPLGSAAHLAIENQRGLTSDPLPLGISVTDGSGGETVTVAGLAEGTELSLGTALGSGSWLVPVADLDKTFVGAPTSFVGAVTAKVTLNSPTGKRLDTRNIRYEWSTPEPYSAPPAGQTEPTRGPTPATSGRAEPTPALGPVQSPPVPETAESFAAPLRPAPSPAAEWSTPEPYSAPPAGQTEPTRGPTPATSGRAEPTPALGPVQSPPVPETAESVAAPTAATPRSCQLLNTCPTKVAKNWRRKRGQNGPTAPTASDVGTLAKKAGSNKAQSPPCLASAAEVRKLTPNAWPKWTYGPNGEQCWYSGQKPFFPKEMPAQAEVIPAPLFYAPTDTRLQAGSNKAQSRPCLASAAEVRKLTPNAWPKWTYGPNGEQCWYFGQKPFFPKEMPAQAEVIPAPLFYAPTDTRLQAGSNKTQSPPCLASAAEVRKLTPNAWPKWTYGPNGERCWYSGEKPVFAKAPN
jgi:hypothetical protein